MKTDNSSFGRVEGLKYMGTNITDQILLRKKLRADLSQEMLAVIRCEMFCIAVCYTKM